MPDIYCVVHAIYIETDDLSYDEDDYCCENCDCCKTNGTYTERED